MCISPEMMQGREVACRRCWQCKSRLVNNHIGKCLAEMQTAYRTDVLTLTYGRDEAGNQDHMKSTILHYEDVQRLLKVLRTAGHKLSYFCVGEYGSKKGRTHWHIVLFWRKPEGDEPALPVFEYDKPKWHWNKWTHGYTFAERPNYETFVYLCKYVLKEWNGELAQSCVNYSKAPSLGADYLADLASKHVNQGIAPRSRLYSFPHVRGKDGSVRQYYMTAAQLDGYLLTFKGLWKLRRGSHPPQTDLLDDWEDRRASKFEDSNFKLEPKPKMAVRPEKPTAPNGQTVYWSEPLMLWYFRFKQGEKYHRVYWTFGKDGRGWHRKIESAEGAVRAEKRPNEYQRRKALVG